MKVSGNLASDFVSQIKLRQEKKCNSMDQIEGYVILLHSQVEKVLLGSADLT